MSHLILSHLSKNNNKPELVEKLFNQQAGGTKIVVASRYEETPVFCISHNNTAAYQYKKDDSISGQPQLSLFIDRNSFNKTKTLCAILISYLLLKS